MKCQNCSNPELWDRSPVKDVEINILMDSILRATKDVEVDGITITGGDPIKQGSELVALLPLLANITNDILLYTGQVYEDIGKLLSKEEQDVITQCVSVMIDGAYIDELNDNICPLRGSSNQRVLFLDESKKQPYTEYMSKGRSIQNVYYGGKMISVGIHNRGL